jgi:glutamine amidotransferase
MMTIIDYGVGNIKAFCNIFDRQNIPYKVASSNAALIDASRIIFPGVGSFDNAMNLLNNSGMRDTLEKRVISDGIPILGICVGMQMFANYSEEGKQIGLGWIDSSVIKFKSEANFPLPHMGWNNIENIHQHIIFEGLSKESYFYFLHSYYFKANNVSNILANTSYGIDFTSVVIKDNIIGVQFHPEKSHDSGTRLLLNFNKFSL